VTETTSRRNRSVLKAALGLLLVFQSFQFALAQMPAEAQKAYDRGLVAADQQLWDLAITNFTAAQKLANREPRVLYSMGLAHAKAGHDLAGAAWLRAYLAMSPDAANAAAVRGEVARLEQSTSDNVKKIFAAATAAARQIPWDDVRWNRLAWNTQWEARTGLIEEALANEQEAYTLSLAIPNDRPEVPGRARVNIKTRSRMQSLIWENYIQYLIDLHDLPKAQEALSHIANADLKTRAQCYIARGLSWKLDNSEAKQLLAEVEQAIARLDDPDAQLSRMLDLADACIVNSQPEMAGKVIESAKTLARKNNLKIDDEDLQTVLKRLSEANKGNFTDFDKRYYYDEVSNSVDLAEFISSKDVVIDLKGQLEQAGHADSNNWAGSESDSIARKLQVAAYSLGIDAAVVRSFDAIDYKWGMFFLTMKFNQEIWSGMGDVLVDSANGKSVINWENLKHSKDKAWQESDTGKAVQKAIDAAYGLNLRAKFIKDEKGWTVAMAEYKTEVQAFVSKERFSDLTSLYSEQSELVDECLQWLRNGERSPMSTAYKAALNAIREEKVP